MSEKFALIVGGSSGIGLATAMKLSKAGFSLLIVHRDRRSVLEEFEKEVGILRQEGGLVITRNIDGTNSEKIEEAIQSFLAETPGLKLSLFLHSLSRGNLKALVSETEPTLSSEDLALTLDAMAINAFVWVKALIHHKLFAPKARVITLTSAGSTKYWPGYGAVAMAKASLEIMTRYLAVELSKYDLRANVIHAGITDTPSLRMIPGYEDLVRVSTERNPLGRMTQPEDIANTVYLLTLPEADWINGTILFADGGEHLVQ